jgi:DNA-binding beta-propeller fold protein YncE
MITQRRFIAGILLLCAAVPGASQTTQAKQAKKKKEVASAAPAPPRPVDLIWPLPPDPPRIRWITEYADLAKVKKPGVRKQSFVEKLSGSKTADEKMELVKPYGIATDRRGRIYAADTELKLVYVIDPAAKTVERWRGNSRVPLALPVGVALDAQDRVFVSDADLHSVICFSPTGEPIAHFGTSSLGRPGGIAIDRPRKRLYVADAKEARVAVFDTESFKLVGFFGGPGKAGRKEDGTFFGPTNVAVDKQGLIYVADTLNYRVQILDANGKFVRAFGAQGDRPGEFIRPKGIAVDSEGHVYVADAEFNNFQILTAEGQPLLAVGSLGTDPGQFALVAGLFIDGEDQIYTTEMFHGRIQVFRYIAQAAPPPRQGGDPH